MYHVFLRTIPNIFSCRGSPWVPGSVLYFRSLLPGGGGGCWLPLCLQLPQGTSTDMPVCMSVCNMSLFHFFFVSFCLCIILSLCHSVCVLPHLCVILSVCHSVCVPSRMCVILSVCPFVCVSVCQCVIPPISVHLFVCQAVCLCWSVFLSVFQSLFVFNCLPVCHFVCLRWFVSVFVCVSLLVWMCVCV